jgi:hypothetical protein
MEKDYKNKSIFIQIIRMKENYRHLSCQLDRRFVRPILPTSMWNSRKPYRHPFLFLDHDSDCTSQEFASVFYL